MPSKTILRTFLAILGCAVAACDGLLNVEVPDRVTAEELEDPKFAEALVIGAIADFECAWDRYSSSASLISGEWIGTGRGLGAKVRQYPLRRVSEEVEGLYGTFNCGDGNFFHYLPLHIARFQSDDVFERLDHNPPPEVPDSLRQRWQARLRALSGWTLLALAESHCEVVLDGGPVMDPAQVLAIAETRFDDAVALAGQAKATDELLFSYAGRARARLDQGDYDAAALDASHIPLGYEARVTRERAPTQRVNSLHSLTVIGPFVTVADHYRGLTLDGEGRPTIGIGASDPRVEVLTDGLLTEDGSLEFHYPTKNFADDGDVPITSYEEAQLIIAEAAARSGDTAQARVVINDLRATEALPAFTAAVATVDEMVDLVIEERRRWLFLEGGARLNDIIRLRGTAHNIPFLGEPGSIHPDGVTAAGVRYGDDICLPLALEDRPGN